MIRFNVFALVGRFVIAFLSEIGRIFGFASQAVPAVVMPPIYFRLILQQMLRIGYFSLPVVGLTAIFNLRVASPLFTGPSLPHTTGEGRAHVNLAD